MAEGAPGLPAGGAAMAALRSTLLATTVVGSYSVPEWLGRLKTDYYQRRISAHHLDEIHDVARAKLRAMVAGTGQVRRELIA